MKKMVSPTRHFDGLTYRALCLVGEEFFLRMRAPSINLNKKVTRWLIAAVSPTNIIGHTSPCTHPKSTPTNGMPIKHDIQH